MGYQTRVDEVGRLEAAIVEPCKVCSDRNKATFVVEQNYFVAFFLPLFPTSRKVFKICPACNARLSLKPNDPNLELVNRILPAKQKLRYWWGIFVLLMIGFALFRFAMTYGFFD